MDLLTTCLVKFLNLSFFILQDISLTCNFFQWIEGEVTSNNSSMDELILMKLAAIEEKCDETKLCVVEVKKLCLHILIVFVLLLSILIAITCT